MPKGPLSLSQLSWYHKALKIAKIVAKNKTELLKKFYEDTQNPDTFESIAKQVWPEWEQRSSNVKFIRKVISLALEQIFDPETFSKIHKIRSDYFSSRIFETIKINWWQKVVDKIRYLGGKATWKKNRDSFKKSRKEYIQSKWLSPRYDDEISFLDAILLDPSYYHTTSGNAWDPNYATIVPLLNQFFHEWENIRNASTVGSFLYKRARSHRSDVEIDYLNATYTTTNPHAIARYLNETYHDGMCVRTASAVDHRAKKQQQELQKMKDLDLLHN